VEYENKSDPLNVGHCGEAVSFYEYSVRKQLSKIKYKIN